MTEVNTEVSTTSMKNLKASGSSVYFFPLQAVLTPPMNSSVSTSPFWGEEGEGEGQDEEEEQQEKIEGEAR